MIKKKTCLNNESYLITPSLLNSWLYIEESGNSVKEAQSDTMSLEDKIRLKQEETKKDFIKTLNREKFEPNKYMLAGIEFEKECYEGKNCVSPIIEGGCFQAVGMKNIEVDGQNFLMYGRLDVLKAGVIYDIKKVIRYSLPKYSWSCQHQFYMELFPKCKEFQYLIFDGKKLHVEKYLPSESTQIAVLIHQFINYLKINNLLDVYKEKWKSLK